MTDPYKQTRDTFIQVVQDIVKDSTDLEHKVDLFLEQNDIRSKRQTKRIFFLKPEMVIMNAFKHILGKMTYDVTEIVREIEYVWDNISYKGKERIQKDIKEYISANKLLGIEGGSDEWERILKLKLQGKR